MVLHVDLERYAELRRRELLERSRRRAPAAGLRPHPSLRARTAGLLRGAARRLEPRAGERLRVLRLLAQGDLDVEQALRLIA